MKTILIATDFSDASRNASLYGIQLAKALNAKVILFSAYRVPPPIPALNMRMARYAIMMQANKRLLHEAYFLDPKKAVIEIMCDEGLAEDAIINIANEKKVDFIIIGMEGRSKNFKKIYGSIATSLSKNSSIPVIIVPEDAGSKNHDIVISANNNNIDSKNVTGQFIAITQLFNSKLYVVKVIKNKYEEWFEVSDTKQKLGKVG